MLPSAFELSVFMKYAHDASNSDSAQSSELWSSFSKYLIDVSNCCVE
jgi:hypothetical protein